MNLTNNDLFGRLLVQKETQIERLDETRINLKLTPYTTSEIPELVIVDQ